MFPNGLARVLVLINMGADGVSTCYNCVLSSLSHCRRVLRPSWFGSYDHRLYCCPPTRRSLVVYNGCSTRVDKCYYDDYYDLTTQLAIYNHITIIRARPNNYDRRVLTRVHCVYPRSVPVRPDSCSSRHYDCFRVLL